MLKMVSQLTAPLSQTSPTMRNLRLIKAQRSGITLLETLVVIGIIGILLAILIPAVQFAREAGRRAACQNNLRQLALAIQEHHSARGEVPNLYNGTFHQNPPTHFDQFHFHSWQSAILPHLGENAVFESLAFELAATALGNQASIDTPIATFVCPSTTTINEFVSGMGRYNNGGPAVDLTGTAARSDYEAIAGFRERSPRPPAHFLDDVALGAWGEPDYGNSLHPMRFKPSRFSELVDGLSNTVLVGERSGRPDTHLRGKPSIPFSPVLGSPGFAEHHQAAWGVSTHILYLVVDKIGVNEHNQRGLYAFHSGGANIALADGSVRLLADSTDVEIVKAIVTRSGREAVAIN